MSRTSPALVLRHASRPSGLGADLLRDLRDATIFWATARAQRLLAGLEDAFFEGAVNATRAQDQDAFFEAMQEVRARRGQFVVALQAAIARRIPFVLASGTRARHPGAGPAGWVAELAEGSSRALERHDGVLAGLNHLLAASGAARGAFCPAGPELLVACLAEALDGLSLAGVTRATVAAGIERGFLEDIDELCAHWAGLLLDAGVEPGDGAPPAAGRDPALAAAEGRVRSALRGPPLTQSRRLAALLAERVAADRRFAPEPRALLARLERCLAHALASDPDFLSTDTHPLRRAYARIGTLALGMPPGLPGDDPRLRALDALAQRLERASADPRGAEAAVAAFESFVASGQHAARLAQRRAAEAGRSRLLWETARAAVRRAVAAEASARPLPPQAEELLREGWQRILVHAWLCEGEDGPVWRAAIAALEQFAGLWAGGAAGLPEPLAAWLRESMLHAGCDPLRTEILLRGVDEELASREPAPVAQAVPLPTVEDAVQAAETGEALAARPPPGTWFEADPDVIPARRACLAEDFGAGGLLFIDAGGHTAATLPHATVAAWIGAGRLRALDARDPIDLALLSLAAGGTQAPNVKCAGAKAW